MSRASFHRSRACPRTPSSRPPGRDCRRRTRPSALSSDNSFLRKFDDQGKRHSFPANHPVQAALARPDKHVYILICVLHLATNKRRASLKSATPRSHSTRPSGALEPKTTAYPGGDTHATHPRLFDWSVPGGTQRLPLSPSVLRAPLWRLWLLPGTLLPAAGAALLLLLGSPANHRGRAAHLHRPAAAARLNRPISANATGHGNMHFPCQPALVYGWRCSLRRATLNSSS